MRIGLDFLSDVIETASGTGTFLHGFLSALSSMDMNNEYFLFVNKGNYRAFKDFECSDFNLVHFPSSNRRRELRVLSQLLLVPYYARKLKLDIIDFFGTTGVISLPCATVQHIKTLHHLLVPDCLDKYTVAFRKFAVRASLRRADMVIANSKFTKDVIKHYFGILDEYIAIIPEAVDSTRFYPVKLQNDKYEKTLKKYKIERPYLLFVSTLWPYKNAEVLIRAFNILIRDSHTKHRLIIVGSDWKGELKRLRQLAKKLGIFEKVKFIGHISDRSTIRDFYVGADVFIYPSLSETFGLTLLEAMACGVPVVASNNASIPEVGGDAASLVNGHDENQLSDAIYKLITDQSLRDDLIRKGFNRARKFTWRRTAQETLEAWKKARETRSQWMAYRIKNFHA